MSTIMKCRTINMCHGLYLKYLGVNGVIGWCYNEFKTLV